MTRLKKSRNQNNVFFIRAYRAIIQNACIPPCLCTENNQGPQPKDPCCKAGSFSIFTKKVPLSASKWTKHIIKTRVLACAKTFFFVIFNSLFIVFLLCHRQNRRSMSNATPALATVGFSWAFGLRLTCSTESEKKVSFSTQHHT